MTLTRQARHASDIPVPNGRCAGKAASQGIEAAAIAAAAAAAAAEHEQCQAKVLHSASGEQTDLLQV